MEVFPQLKVICRFQSLPIWGEALILYVGCAAGQSPKLKRLQIFSVPAVSLLWQLPAHWGLFPGCIPPSPQDSCNRLRPPHYCWVSSLCCRLNYLIVSNWRRELQQMLNVSSTLDISTPSISPNLATVLCHCYPSCVLWLRHSSPLRVGLKHNSEYLWALPVSSSSPSCLIERTLCTMWRFNTESEPCFCTPWKQLSVGSLLHILPDMKKITSNTDVLCSSRAGSALHRLHALKYTTFSFCLMNCSFYPQSCCISTRSSHCMKLI